MKEYENFEIDDPEYHETEKIRQYQFLAKIIIVLAIIIVFEIIYILVSYSSIKEKNSEISNINLKKYMIADGNKKLDRALNEDFKMDYAYDEETKKKDNEIKSKEKLIKDFKHKIKKLQKSLNNSQPIEDLQAINNEKKENVNELKTNLEGRIKSFRSQFNSRIFDSAHELNDIKALIENNIVIEEEKEDEEKKEKEKKKEVNLHLCYYYDSKQGNEFNYDEATFTINFNENKVYVIVFQTDIFGRYGVVIPFRSDGKYLVFDMNNKYKKDNLFESNWLEFKFDRTNLKLLINNIKEFAFENKNKYIDYMKHTNIIELEIYKVY